MKFIPSAIILCAFGLPLGVQAADFAYRGCRYQGSAAQQTPHGKGVLNCPDGRIYTGRFQNGEFHDMGQFVSPDTADVFLPSFGMRSGKLKGFVLSGNFAHGMAEGDFKVYQNGKHLFNMQFDKGMVKTVSTAK